MSQRAIAFWKRPTMRWLITAVAAPFRWLKGLFVGPPTEDQLRQAAKAKQRDIRRELRGLPPETTPAKVKPDP
jgi:hypothetical protein